MFEHMPRHQFSRYFRRTLTSAGSNFAHAFILGIALFAMCECAVADRNIDPSHADRSGIQRPYHTPEIHRPWKIPPRFVQPAGRHKSRTISGTVELSGCAIDTRQLKVAASAIDIDMTDAEQPLQATRRHTDDAARYSQRNSHDKFALFKRTRDPHRVHFTVGGLNRNGLYQLSISYAESDCGKIFWRGPLSGIASPGQHAVKIEGFAARTQIEVFDDESQQWLATGRLDLSQDGSTGKRFRWRSDVPGVIGGELQIATSAFPVKGNFGACDVDERSLLLRRTINIGDEEGWSQTEPVDFRSLLLDSEDDAENALEKMLHSARLRQISLGAPLYLRVIPLTEQGPACNTRSDGISGWSIVAQLPDTHYIEVPDFPPPLHTVTPGDGHQYHPPFIVYKDGLVRPTLRESGFQVTKDHQLPNLCFNNPSCFQTNATALVNDPIGYTMVVTGFAAAGTTITKGTRFYLTLPSHSNNSSNILEQFTDSLGRVVTGGVDLFGSIVDYTSQAWNDIQAAVSNAVLQVISVTVLGPVCDKYPETCAAIVETALTSAMMAVGLPPSIPNFEELQQQGLDYLASEIVEQAGVSNDFGITKALTDEVLDNAYDLARKTMQQITDNRGSEAKGYDWLLPYSGIEPASAIITLKHNRFNPLPTNPLPKNLALAVVAAPLYRSAILPIPTTFPAGDELRIPVVLQPNFTRIASPRCRIGYTGPECEPFYPPETPPLCEHIQRFNNVESWVAFDCSIQSPPLPVKYYRDAWIQDYLNTTSCNFIGGATKLDTGFGTFLIDAPEEFQTWVGAAVRPDVSFTWNGATGSNCH